MLNYVWSGLIVIGILVAVGNDIGDEFRNPYRNGVPLDAQFEAQKSPGPLRSTWEGDLIVSAERFRAFYGVAVIGTEVRVPASIAVTTSRGNSITLHVSDESPELWKDMARAGVSKDILAGTVEANLLSGDQQPVAVKVLMEPVRFVKMKAVTQAALDYATTAVTIALGLIGIMALWLGVMKIAEEAGILRTLTRLLTPLTRRLFPDVPPDHPAVGAMIMNIAANMLGLSNAATPLGLKAMEELNKLNPKIGTATNAMVTFLTINTGGLILLPATAIAVRAAAGSANPGIIIGTSIVGASCATIAGVAAAKLLQRLPVYRKSLEADHG